MGDYSAVSEVFTSTSASVADPAVDVAGNGKSEPDPDGGGCGNGGGGGIAEGVTSGGNMPIESGSEGAEGVGGGAGAGDVAGAGASDAGAGGREGGG